MSGWRHRARGRRQAIRPRGRLGGMTVWLISVLERPSPRALRLAVAVVALLLMGAVITASTVAPSPDSAIRSRGPARRPPAGQRTTAPAPRRLARPVPLAQLVRAHGAAERFLGTFLAFAYGRARAPEVSAVTPALRRQLTGERARITPVERRGQPSVVSLGVVGMTPGFALATAMVSDGGITAYPLRFTLLGRADRWVVCSVQQG